MSLTAEVLVERLFFAGIKELRDLLQTLDDKQRSVLFKESKAIIKTLRDVCSAYPNDYGKTVTLKKFYKQVMPHLIPDHHWST